MNSDNSDYIFFHINYDPPGEYQFVHHVVYLTRRYKGVVLDIWLHKSISLLAINNQSYPAPPTLKYKNVLLLIKKF